MENLATEDKQLSELRQILVSEPYVENIIARFIEQDRAKMVEILFPIIGATIKRSVTETFRSWAQSAEEIIKRSFTIEGLKWRFESMRTGIPITQIAILQSLLFRVEHVFLIHKDSNKVLCKTHRQNGVDTDSVLFTNIMTVINDFVRDVFISHQKPKLSSVQFDKYTVWFSEAGSLILATIIWGNPSLDLKMQLQNTLNNIMFKKSKILESNTFDEKNFADCDLILEDLLIKNKKAVEPAKDSARNILYIASGLILALISLFIIKQLQENYTATKYDRLLTQIRNTEDIFLVDFNKDERLSLSVIALSTFNVRDNIQNMAAKLKLKRSDLDINVVDIARLDAERRYQQEKLLKSKLSPLDGKVLTTHLKIDPEHLSAILRALKDPYFLSQQMNQPFILVLEYPRADHKMRTDSLAGYMRHQLEREGIYDFHLIRTRQNPRLKEIALVIQQEKPKFTHR